MLLGNPHFLIGPERFYQAHLTIPGKLDVGSVALRRAKGPDRPHAHARVEPYGSTAYRFTPFELKLVPGTPTSYLVDGRAVPMTERTVTVQARQPGGGVAPVSRTLLHALGAGVQRAPGLLAALVRHHGVRPGRCEPRQLPRLQPLLRDGPGPARCPRRCGSCAATRAALGEHDRRRPRRRALYADIGTIPHVTNELAARCNTPIGQVAYASLGSSILTGRAPPPLGSDSDAAAPGILGPGRLAAPAALGLCDELNDSYWLSNPEALEGYARIIGDERTARSLRTRIGLIMTRQQIEAGGFTCRAMQRMVFSNRQYAGEPHYDALVGVCRSLSGGMAPTSDGPPVAIGNACDVLAAWDLRENLPARCDPLPPLHRHVGGGRPVVDAVHGQRSGQHAEHQRGQRLCVALGDAISDLNAAGIALEARVGDVQGVTAAVGLIPVHGGPGDPHGQFTCDSRAVRRRLRLPRRRARLLLRAGGHLEPGPLPGRGHDPHLLAVGEPALAASQRSDAALLRKRWVRGRFCRRDVLAGTRSTTVPRRRR